MGLILSFSLKIYISVHGMINLDIAATTYSCQDGRAAQGARPKVNHLSRTQWERAFWSPNGAVGSNPTSDNVAFYDYCFFFCIYRCSSYQGFKLRRVRVIEGSTYGGF